jgi:hypothetical protein
MQATGIQTDGPVFRRAVVRRICQNLQIVELKEHPIQEGQVKPLYLEGLSGPLVSGLHSNDMILRSHAFAPAKSAKLRSALVLQAEAQLHLKPEELITIAVIDGQKKTATTFTTTQTALNDHLKAMKRLQLDPVRVSATPVALQTLVRWKAPELSSYFLVDIGHAATNCVWVEQDSIVQAHAIAIGLQQLKTAFQEDRKKSFLKEPLDLDFAALKTTHYPVLAEEARSFRRELSRLVHSFQCQRPIIFTGDLEFNGFREFLLESLHDCISEEKKIGLSNDELRFSVPLGLALDYLINREQPVQFRTGGSLSHRSWRQLGCYGTGLLAAALAFCAMVYGVGSWWMDKRNTEIVHSLETWTAAKDPALRVELFSAGNETKDLVDQWLHLIDKNAKDYRFLIKAPSVSRFLDFLTRHPLLESFRLAGDPMSFEQIHYQLLSFPRLDALQDPYAVKVDLEFKVSSPLHARKFHETLLQGNGIIDGSHEITWEVLTDRYKASFYLKNE